MKNILTRTFLVQLALIIYAFITMSVSGCNNNESSRVVIHTDFGDMIVELSDSTPQHRDNFLKLAKEGFYDGLLFHRVIETFMIQGGDPESRGAQKGDRLGGGGPGYTVEAEFRNNHVHIKGALSAARQGDSVNPEKRSSGSQFYIVQGKKWKAGELLSHQSRIQVNNPDFEYSDELKKMYEEIGGTPFLDMEYTVFGYVVEGLNVLDSIAAVKKGAGDRPIEDVKFSVEILK